MGLDIPLMHRFQRVTPGHGSRGRGERPFDVAATHLDAHCRIRGLVRLRIDAFGKDVVVQDRRAFSQRFLHAEHERQLLIFDFDQRQSLAGDLGAGRSNGRNCVALVENLIECEAVVRNIDDVRGAFADMHHQRFQRRQVPARRHGLDPGKGLGLTRIDRDDPGVRMRTAQDRAPEHPRRLEIGAVERPARDLVDTVGTHRARADMAELLHLFGRVHAGVLSWRSSAAASSTARTILS